MGRTWGRSREAISGERWCVCVLCVGGCTCRKDGGDVRSHLGETRRLIWLDVKPDIGGS